MKKILSFLILSVFFFIGFIHNSMMVFAVNNMDIEEDILCCLDNSEKSADTDCIKSCCLEGSIDHGISVNNSVKKKIFQIIYKSYSIDFSNKITYLFKNKNLINKTSPPYLDRKISNYSYQTLIKIIKSNT